MKRILALLIAVVMAFSLAACGNDDTENNINAGDDITSSGNGAITTETTNNNSESENKNDATESDITDITSETEKVEYTFDGTYALSFAEFDETVLSYECIKSAEKEIFSSGIGAGIAAHPSTKIPANPVIEKINTKDDLFSNLDKYIDMRSNIDAYVIVEMHPQKFIYRDIDTYWKTNSFITVLNKKADYYFIGHPNFPGLQHDFENDFNVDEIYHDKDTGNLYIILKDGYADREKDSDTSYAFLYLYFEEEFTKTNKIGDVYLMYRQ